MKRTTFPLRANGRANLILCLLLAPVLAYAAFGIGQAAGHWIHAEFLGGGHLEVMWVHGQG